MVTFQLYLNTVERGKEPGEARKAGRLGQPLVKGMMPQALGCVLSCGLARAYAEGFSDPTGVGKFCLWRGTRPSGEE